MDTIIYELQELDRLHTAECTNYKQEIEKLRGYNKELVARIDSYEMKKDSTVLMSLELQSYEATVEELRTEIKRLNIDLEFYKTKIKTKTRPIM